MRVALFATCLVDTVAPQVARATAVLLERLGHEVVVPPGQACCGQMHVNTGYRREAVPIVANHVRAFAGALSSGVEAIVAPSGSCVAAIHHQQADLLRRAGEHGLAAEASALAERTYELSQFLVDVLGVTDVGAYYPHRVTYHPTCHSLRMLHVGERPLQLLRAVRGLELVELPGAEECCGFGGTFSVKNADVSTAMLTDKMANVLATHAEVCTAGDASCLMQIGGGLSRLRAGTRTVHLAEILASTEESVSQQRATKPAVRGFGAKTSTGGQV
jgi:L-lactate dehydrogenase complex protein LldE